MQAIVHGCGRDARLGRPTIVGSRSDITEIKTALAESEAAHVALAHQAAHDPLTDLPNRRRFLADLTMALKRPEAVSVLYLDRFKPVNDQHGHAAGDCLLKEVARRVRALLPDGAAVAHLGGDEFAVVLTGAGGACAVEIGQEIVEALARPAVLRSGPVQIGVSIGLATAASDEAGHLLDRADDAMYAAKRRGGGRVEVWRELQAAA